MNDYKEWAYIKERIAYHPEYPYDPAMAGRTYYAYDDQWREVGQETFLEGMLISKRYDYRYSDTGVSFIVRNGTEQYRYSWCEKTYYDETLEHIMDNVTWHYTDDPAVRGAELSRYSYEYNGRWDPTRIVYYLNGVAEADNTCEYEYGHKAKTIIVKYASGYAYRVEQTFRDEEMKYLEKSVTVAASGSESIVSVRWDEKNRKICEETFFGELRVGMVTYEYDDAAKECIYIERSYDPAEQAVLEEKRYKYIYF